MCNLIEISGIIKYDSIDYKVYVDLDDDIARYYREMIPKHLTKPKPQRYKTHITIVRNEKIINMDNWLRYDGLEVNFKYNPIEKNNGIYFWLDVYSDKLEQLRTELGLQKSSEFSRPPSDEECFHITIGNLK